MRIACLVLVLTVSAHAQSAASKPAECAEYAAKLESCAPYVCTFTHPMTGAQLQRKIVGLADGACVTSEAMPGKRTMQCALPANMRKAVATFFRKTQAAETAGQVVGGSLTLGANGKAETTSTVDGKLVGNPLQQALASGACKIGG